ncbi:sensor histidine kinase [Arenicella xantha]|uniref:histidine kinase n=1 Tax=Arenicella xantha TaxID=644221 RepID=A0A395JNG4_9GAMM|nr:HAMP domain-containing sensor histidine kinase [Arenicella xantha]RBP53204.1 phospho-acceptor domain-containing protein [Arenicella xantha]
MKYKFPLLFAILVVVPLAVLASLAARLYSQESIVQDHQAQVLADLRLREASNVIDRYFDGLKQDSFNALQFLEIEGNALKSEQISAIRGLIQADPILDQVFVLNADGERLFPPKAALASRSEENFVLNTQTLWNDQDAFRVRAIEAPLMAANTNDRSAITSPAVTSSTNSSVNLSKSIDEYRSSRVSAQSLADASERVTQQSGWTTWDVGTETQTFFWYRDAANNLIGQKLAQAYWLSELINRLPDDRDARALLGDARIKLTDRSQETVYQWGPYEPSVHGHVEPNAQKLLGHPLDGWRLAYFNSKAGVIGGFKQLVFISSLLALGLVLLGLSVYIWREMRRDLRVAEQRVTFVNQVSHELKTPLTNICMYSDMLDSEVNEAEQIDRARVGKYSEVVRSESQRLARLINNVLGFSRAQQHDVQLRKSSVIVDEVIRQTVKVFEPALNAKGIAVELVLDASTPVLIDAGVLEQVLNNLLSNVEKYAASGKWLKITSHIDNGAVQLDVIDAGPGLGYGNDRLFEPFERGDSRLNQGISGTGIGLSISRQLARAHGGDLTVKTTERGAWFILTLSADDSDELDQKSHTDRAL